MQASHKGVKNFPMFLQLLPATVKMKLEFILYPKSNKPVSLFSRGLKKKVSQDALGINPSQE